MDEHAILLEQLDDALILGHRVRHAQHRRPAALGAQQLAGRHVRHQLLQHVIIVQYPVADLATDALRRVEQPRATPAGPAC